MSTAHDYLAEIARAGAGRFASTSLASSHAGVTRRVRRHRTARAAASTVAGIGVIGGATWGGLEAFSRGNALAPGLPASSAAASPSTAPTAPLTDCGAAALLITDPSATAYHNGELPSEVLCEVSDGWGTVTLRGDAGVALESALLRVRELGVTGPIIAEGYRDLSTQERIADTRGYLAPSPGTSPHGTGLAIDLTGDDASYNDFAVVAAELGWVRTLDSEPWHFEYQPGASDQQILIEQRMTIYEGETLNEIAAKMGEIFGVPQEDALAAIASSVTRLIPEASTAEGWPMPSNAIVFGEGTSLSDAADALVHMRIQELTDLGVPRADWQTVITKASLVEREAKLDVDRPKIARVIDNRLDQGRKLELDSTVRYFSPDESVFTSDAERATDSPYNTYLYQGLPPGAIGAPSEESVRAVLSPAEGDWLYFVTVNLTTGETAYATTFEDHLANVALMQEWIDANSGN